jgi:hypothetical protein
MKTTGKKKLKLQSETVCSLQLAQVAGYSPITWGNHQRSVTLCSVTHMGINPCSC